MSKKGRGGESHVESTAFHGQVPGLFSVDRSLSTGRMPDLHAHAPEYLSYSGCPLLRIGDRCGYPHESLALPGILQLACLVYCKGTPREWSRHCHYLSRSASTGNRGPTEIAQAALLLPALGVPTSCSRVVSTPVATKNTLPRLRLGAVGRAMCAGSALLFAGQSELSDRAGSFCRSLHTPSTPGSMHRPVFSRCIPPARDPPHQVSIPCGGITRI